MGVTKDQIATARMVQRAREARAVGLTIGQLAELEAAADEAYGKGRGGLAIAEWTKAIGRDEYGRKQARR